MIGIECPAGHRRALALPPAAERGPALSDAVASGDDQVSREKSSRRFQNARYCRSVMRSSSVPASSPFQADSSERCCSLTDMTIDSTLSSTRPAASSRDERGSSTNLDWIPFQRVFGLVLSLATGAAGAGPGSAAGDTEKAKGAAASSLPARPGSAAVLPAGVTPGYPDAAGAGGWGSPSGMAPAGSQLSPGMFWSSSGPAW